MLTTLGSKALTWILPHLFKIGMVLIVVLVMAGMIIHMKSLQNTILKRDATIIAKDAEIAERKLAFDTLATVFEESERQRKRTEEIAVARQNRINKLQKSVAVLKKEISNAPKMPGFSITPKLRLALDWVPSEERAGLGATDTQAEGAGAVSGD
jgi:predicted Holliday junction resolvase-like endonuclease